MSASDKKKLRKEQTADLLTERQRQEQAEAKKLKTYTTIFVVAMIFVVCVALTVLGIRAVNNSGIIQRNTVAATVGDQQMNSAELNYYYVDAVNNMYSEWYSQYSNYTDTYLQMMGLDTKMPLDEQIQDEETGTTWSAYFIEEALADAKSDIALYNQAMKENFKLPDEEQSNLDNLLNNLSTYAAISGYSNADQYLRAMYGYGSNEDSYREYCERSAIADAFAAAHEESLSYDDAAIRAYEADKSNNYNSYNYTSCYMSYTYFQQGGSEDEDGNITYSDEEKDAARAQMKTVAEALGTATSVEDLEKKVAEVKVSEGNTLTVTLNENALHSSLNATVSEWLASEDRKEGDIAALPNTSTTKNEDGEEVTVTNGYYVVIYHSTNDNTDLMSNVRHLLVKFEGGTEDEETGETLYSTEEKAAAKTKAEGYLKTWQEGEKTEESFIALVKEHSDDTSAEEGGLFEDINPDSQYVENFLNWSINPDRKAGDAEVIETEYGYHVMYYVGDDELTYRDYMITNEMRAADQDSWYNGLVDAVNATVADTSKMNLDLVLSSGS